MKSKTLLVSEPWDFINPLSKKNKIEIKYEEKLQYNEEKADLFRLLKPFDYFGERIEMLLLIPRYKEGLKKNTYNILNVDEVSQSGIIVNARFLFIGSLEL